MANVITPWGEMTNTARSTLLAGIAIILLLTIGGFFWLAGEDYQVLFADMEPRDAANVVTELERLKIEYKLGNQGSQILVLASSVHQVRLKLMGAGVPLVGGVGFEIFDNSDFGMTEFAQRVNYQRALEGELTRTIMSLKEVKYVRVHLVMPEKGLFQQDDNPSSASVTLFLKPQFLHAGQGPAREQILGIQRLVAAAVPSLKAGQVTVTDQAGITLSEPITEQKSMAAVSERLQQKQAVEAYLIDKVNEVLVTTFGVNQAMVSIDVELDFNEVRRTYENVVAPDDSESGVIRRREIRTGNGAEKKSAAGNVTTEVEYRLGRTVEQTVETPGKILRLSVGVMVPAGTTSIRRNEIRQLVEMTVGLNSTRGDAIAVYTMDQASTLPAVTQTQIVLPEQIPHSAGLEPPREHFSVQWVKRYPLAVVITVVAAGVLSILVIVLLFVNRLKRKPPVPNGPPALSSREREQALAKVKQWLENANASERGELL